MSHQARAALVAVLVRIVAGLSPHEGWVNVTHHLVGCFPRSAADTDDELAFHDRACVNATSISSGGEEVPCRSGLPFFRLALQKGQSYLDCFTFCLSKGLDLCGVVHSERAGAGECRCGATPLNQAVWGGEPPPSRLLLLGSPVAEDDERCQVIVWWYTGGLENGAVPTPLMHQSLSDQAYVEGIVRQVDPDTALGEEEPEGAQGNVRAQAGPDAIVDEEETGDVAGAPRRTDVCRDNNDVGRNIIGHTCQEVQVHCNDASRLGAKIRAACPITCGVCSEKWGWLPCYPHACVPGGGPWPKTGNALIVNYYYDSTIVNDRLRRAAFEKAKGEWESRTCVRFRYSQSLPTIRVWQDPRNTDDCSSGIGYPGRQGTLSINLGWCRNDDHVWNMVHELGHALGMNHEQKRPDAAPQGTPDGNGYRSQRFYTPSGYMGPYLDVKWGQVRMRSQWEPDTRSYIGSQHVGYAHYDYGSLMHYRLTRGVTVASGRNKAWESVIGQRDGLSDGDISQFKDMYQC